MFKYLNVYSRGRQTAAHHAKIPGLSTNEEEATFIVILNLSSIPLNKLKWDT